MSTKRILFIPVAVVAAAVYAMDAQAYIGPGAGLSAIGSLLALVAVFVVGVLGFVWFPIKRLLRKRGSVAGSAIEPTEMDGARPIPEDQEKRA